MFLAPLPQKWSIIGRSSCTDGLLSKTVYNLSAGMFLVSEGHKCPLGDIMDVPDSCNEKFDFCIVGSSSAFCPLFKTKIFAGQK